LDSDAQTAAGPSASPPAGPSAVYPVGRGGRGAWREPERDSRGESGAASDRTRPHGGSKGSHRDGGGDGMSFALTAPLSVRRVQHYPQRKTKEH